MKKIRDEDMFSNAKYSTYAGWEVTGWPKTTIRRGEVVFDNGKIVAKAGLGQVHPGRALLAPDAAPPWQLAGRVETAGAVVDNCVHDGADPTHSCRDTSDGNHRTSQTMFITQTSLPRRSFLRGVGATLALPLLDAMVPALAPMLRAAAAPTRAAFIYVPHGVILDQFVPANEGSNFEYRRSCSPSSDSVSRRRS